MAENKKPLKASQLQKCDTTENWNKAKNFIPVKGQIIIYQDFDGEKPLPPKHKVGDGKTLLSQLEFAAGGTASLEGENTESLSEHALAFGKESVAGSKGFRYYRQGHNILRVAEKGDISTTYAYTCSCSICTQNASETSFLYSREFGNEVFDLDLTAFQTGEMRYDADTGRVYRHFPANNQQTTTTITIQNVPYGIVMFVKYRLNNGAIPTKDFATSVKYGGITNDSLNGLMAEGTAKASALSTYHEGWVVGRLNCLGNARTNGLCNSAQNAIPAGRGLAQSITITFIHYEDFDLEFFITDDGEDNAGVFPTLHETGDKYYLVTASSILGTHSGTDRWRQVPATGTTAATISDSSLNGYKTPYLRDAAGSEVKPSEYEIFYIVPPEEPAIAQKLLDLCGTEPDCSIITNNEYPHIPLRDYNDSINSLPIKIYEDGKELVVWRLSFNTDDFGRSIKEPTGNWEDDAPYKKTIRFNSLPELGDTDIGMYSSTWGIRARSLNYGGASFGRDTTVEGSYGAAFGRGTTARYAGFSAGRDTRATGDASASFGYDTEATDTYSLSTGSGTKAKRLASHAGGIGTIASAEAQTAIGKYNAEESTAMLIVGSGRAQANQQEPIRENCFTAGKDGDDCYIQIGATRITEQQLINLLSSGASPKPAEVGTEEDMTMLLNTAEVGTVYRYTGETNATYENGELYIVEAVSE